MMNQFQNPMGQSLFPTPTGSVYSLNTASDIGNVPAGVGISVGLCLQENVMYIKALQNGSPMLLGYKLSPIEGSANSQSSTPISQDGTEELIKENKKLIEVLKGHEEKIQMMEEGEGKMRGGYMDDYRDGRGGYRDGGYRDGGYGNYDDDSYGRRGVPGSGRGRGGRYRGDDRWNEHLDRIMDGADMYQYGRSRYRDGGDSERMYDGLEKLMYAICMFIESTMDFAESPEEKEIIRKHIQKLKNI